MSDKMSAAAYILYVYIYEKNADRISEYIENQKSDGMSEYMNISEMRCQIECQNICQTECQIVMSEYMPRRGLHEVR